MAVNLQEINLEKNTSLPPTYVILVLVLVAYPNRYAFNTCHGDGTTFGNHRSVFSVHLNSPRSPSQIKNDILQFFKKTHHACFSSIDHRFFFCIIIQKIKRLIEIHNKCPLARRTSASYWKTFVLSNVIAGNCRDGNTWSRQMFNWILHIIRITRAKLIIACPSDTIILC